MGEGGVWPCALLCQTEKTKLLIPKIASLDWLQWLIFLFLHVHYAVSLAIAFRFGCCELLGVFWLWAILCCLWLLDWRYKLSLRDRCWWIWTRRSPAEPVLVLAELHKGSNNTQGSNWWVPAFWMFIYHVLATISQLFLKTVLYIRGCLDFKI